MHLVFKRADIKKEYRALIEMDKLAHPLDHWDTRADFEGSHVYSIFEESRRGAWINFWPDMKFTNSENDADWKAPGWLYVGSVTIDPSFAGRDVEICVMAWLIDYAKKNNCIGISTNERISSPLIEVWRNKFGFQTIGMDETYWSDSEKPETNVELALQFN